jgi:hypothetical protein
MDMKQLITQPEKAPHIHPEDLSLHLVYLQKLPGVTRDWTSRKHKKQQQPIRGQRQAKNFLKKPSAKNLVNCSI